MDSANGLGEGSSGPNFFVKIGTGMDAGHLQDISAVIAAWGEGAGANHPLEAPWTRNSFSIILSGPGSRN